MNVIEETINATLGPNGQLRLTQRPQVPPGRVRVTIRVDAAGPSRGLADVIREIAAEQRSRGFPGRSAADLRAEDDARQAEDDARDRELDAQGRWGSRAGLEFPAIKLLDYAPAWQALEASRNPFAVLVLARLRTLETSKDAGTRQQWKLRLVKGLYECGLAAEDVRQLFRFIDWMMELPPALKGIFWQD